MTSAMSYCPGLGHMANPTQSPGERRGCVWGWVSRSTPSIVGQFLSSSRSEGSSATAFTPVIWKVLFPLMRNSPASALAPVQTCSATSGQLLLVSGSCWSNHGTALCFNGLRPQVPFPPLPPQSLLLTAPKSSAEP